MPCFVYCSNQFVTMRFKKFNTTIAWALKWYWFIDSMKTIIWNWILNGLIVGLVYRNSKGEFIQRSIGNSWNNMTNYNTIEISNSKPHEIAWSSQNSQLLQHNLKLQSKKARNFKLIKTKFQSSTTTKNGSIYLAKEVTTKRTKS